MKPKTPVVVATAAPTPRQAPRPTPEAIDAQVRHVLEQYDLPPGVHDQVAKILAVRLANSAEAASLFARLATETRELSSGTRPVGTDVSAVQSGQEGSKKGA